MSGGVAQIDFGEAKEPETFGDAEKKRSRLVNYGLLL